MEVVLEVYADQGWSWYKVLVANWGQGIILAKGAVMSQVSGKTYVVLEIK